MKIVAFAIEALIMLRDLAAITAFITMVIVVCVGSRP